MADTVLILEPGDEQALKIAKAMSSQTANDILNLLREGEKNSTEITERLAIPFTTVKYHIENLLEAGLIAVTATRYSVKGREIKIYGLTNQLLIVAPKRADVRSLLLKYASLFGIVIFGVLAITLVLPLMTIQGGMNAAPMQAERDAGIMAAKATYGAAAPSFTSLPETAIAFFFGGLLVICVLLCYEAYLWKKVR